MEWQLGIKADQQAPYGAAPVEGSSERAPYRGSWGCGAVGRPSVRLPGASR